MRKKRTDTESKEKEKQSRAKYSLLPELEEMIRMVNLVPIGTDFFSFQDEVRARDLIERQNIGQRPAISLTAVLKDLLSKLPDEAQNFIKNRLFFEDSPDLPAPIDPDNASQNEITDLISCYTHFYYFWADILQYIIQRKHRRNGKSFADDLLPIHAFVTGDSNGNEKLFGFAGLIGKFDGDRLRMCEICAKVFWAKYKNSVTCSKPCLNALRQRKHRQKNKEAINTKRREYYRQNKKLKAIKEKKNGTL